MALGADPATIAARHLIRQIAAGAAELTRQLGASARVGALVGARAQVVAQAAVRRWLRRRRSVTSDASAPELPPRDELEAALRRVTAGKVVPFAVQRFGYYVCAPPCADQALHGEEGEATTE